MTGMRAGVTGVAAQNKDRVHLIVDEVFEPKKEKEPILEGLRNPKFGGFGTDTGIDRDSTQVLADNLANTRKRALAALAMQNYLQQ